MLSTIYQQARYYEIAFGFVDVVKHVDLLEAYMRTYRLAPVTAVLDVCCGPGRQTREFARRGYHAVGLDASPDMLEYLRARASEEHVSVETVQADMMDFTLPSPVEFAYNLMGSVVYVTSSSALIAHLSSMARALSPGGLYLIENLGIDWGNPQSYLPQTWEMAKDGILIRTTYRMQPVNALEQTACHTLRFDVDDHGEVLQCTEEVVVRQFYPEEFKAIVEMHGAFEFMGFFERERFERLTEISSDNYVLLRKR